MNKSILILFFALSSILTSSQKFQKAVIENMDGSTKTGLVNGKSLSDSKEIKFKTAELRKEYKIKLPNAIIAATSIVYDLILITRNTKDFSDIKNLQILNPYNI